MADKASEHTKKRRNEKNGKNDTMGGSKKECIEQIKGSVYNESKGGA